MHSAWLCVLFVIPVHTYLVRSPRPVSVCIFLLIPWGVGCITYRYKEFREVLSEQVGAGPETVARCLLDYDTALCGYLGVARNPPPSSPKTKVSCPICIYLRQSLCLSHYTEGESGQQS